MGHRADEKVICHLCNDQPLSQAWQSLYCEQFPGQVFEQGVSIFLQFPFIPLDDRAMQHWIQFFQLH